MINRITTLTLYVLHDARIAYAMRRRRRRVNALAINRIHGISVDQIETVVKRISWNDDRSWIFLSVKLSTVMCIHQLPILSSIRLSRLSRTTGTREG